MTQPNAVAGPSHTGQSSAQSAQSATTAAGTGFKAFSTLEAYIAPAPAQPRPRSIIHPTQDLLGRYGILPVYDEFVRPFTTSAPGTVEDKGKRKEDGQDGPEDARHGPKEGLFQHGYKHFIKDLGLGKHNHKKDTFLADLMLNPEKPPVPILKLDRTTLIHAFRLKEGGVPGFNASALTGDDKERKKKKKKRPIDPSQPSAPTTPAAAQAAIAPGSAIRRPGGPLPPSQLASSHVPASAQQPAQRPVSQQPPQQRHPLAANPKAATRPPGTGPGAVGTTGAGMTKRKDREDAGANGHVNTTGGMGGMGGTGLKPAKKRKMCWMVRCLSHGLWVSIIGEILEYHYERMTGHYFARTRFELPLFYL
ncbi:hypothetical protein CTheo_4060 [Ceratobasidium theobromae]|uniref:Mediator of RNA polymerase II transcription subunit 19 n=1 Tax=Ceratobasidium theobromae TaxID=1582974 RepID=A0A5N5QLU5_9AGAM|nr:hypothetical protein CTheo_4060 [Ceratobasidium theobromae]